MTKSSHTTCPKCFFQAYNSLKNLRWATYHRSGEKQLCSSFKQGELYVKMNTQLNDEETYTKLSKNPLDSKKLKQLLMGNDN